MEKKNLSEKQPTAQHNSLTPSWDLVLQDIKERDEFGLKKHGTRLQPFNGRRTDIDIYQELLDATVYMRTFIAEQEKTLELVQEIFDMSEDPGVKALARKILDSKL